MMSWPVNYIDLILMVVVAISMFNGWRKGFIDSFIGISIWLGSFLLALLLSEPVIRLLHWFELSALWVRPAFFIILLIFFSRLIFVLCDRLSAAVPDETHVHWANKAAGLFPGLLSGAIYAALLSFFFLSYPFGQVTENTGKSLIAGVLTRPGDWPGKQISSALKHIGYRLSSSLTIHPRGTDLIRLPFKSDRIRVRKDLERNMLELINTERRKAGVPPLEFDEDLAVVARKHSADMFRRGYFSHYTPEGKGPFDRMRQDRITFRTAGENLALAQTLILAHEGLLESQVHKDNLLHRSFGRIGIGILDGGVHGIMITQNFRN